MPRFVRPGPAGRVLRLLCQASAMLGGILLIGIALMTLSSVAGRVLWSSPIQGDVEMVQLACAVSLASFLPYTQWQGTNIMIDFFTARAYEAHAAVGSMRSAPCSSGSWRRWCAGAPAWDPWRPTTIRKPPC